MEKWRERLKAALEAKGLTMKAASVQAGLNEAYVSEVLRGNEPKAKQLISLAEKLGLSLDEVLLGRDEARPEILRSESPKLAHVVGVVQAGLWYDESHPPQVEYEPIPYVPTRYPNLKQVAYRVQGSSMNLRKIEDGDFVIAVPYWEVRIAPQDRDLVVVERRRDGGEIERTVKEVAIQPEHIELWPRSSDPAWQKPILIPRDQQPSDFVEVEIVGLVVGRYSPL